MSDFELEQTLLDHVDAFVYDPPLPVAYPNRPYDPDGIRYLEVLHLPNASSRMFLDGADPEWQHGILQLNIKTRLDKGPEEGVQIYDALVAHFPADLILTGADGLRVQISKRPDRATGFPDSKSWTTPVSVRYEVIS